MPQLQSTTLMQVLYCSFMNEIWISDFMMRRKLSKILDVICNFTVIFGTAVVVFSVTELVSLRPPSCFVACQLSLWLY